MIKIIKRGLTVREIYRGICPRCSCEFECDKEDFGYRLSGAGYIDCPSCGYTIDKSSMSVKTIRDIKED